MKLLFIIGCLALFLLFSGPEVVFTDYSWTWHFDDHFLHSHFFESMWGIVAVIGIVFAVIAFGVFFTVGIIGIVCASLFVVGLVLLISGVALFWPFILFGAVIWLLIAEKKPQSV